MARVAALSMAAAAFVSLPGSPAAAESSGAAPGSPRGAAASIAAGGEHTCVLDVSDDIRCWGSDVFGQVGDGRQGDESGVPRVDPSAPTDLPGSRTATSIALGGENSCAVLDDRTITCWGSDERGQNGDGNLAPNIFVPENIVETKEDIVTLAVGDQFICGQYVSGKVGCWGQDDNGQLGNGGDIVVTPPGDFDVDVAENAPDIALPSGRTVTALTAGARHACAVLDNGDVTCWGDNSSDQVGNSASGDQIVSPSAALTMPGDRRAVGVSAGGEHTCALLDDGSVACWGSDDDGELGNGSTTGDKSTPQTVTLPEAAVAVAAGGSHSCAVLASGNLTCWGKDSKGQLGDGGNGNDEASPTPTIRTGVRAIALGDEHTCVLLDGSNGVTCWGENGQGQLGNGTTTDLGSPGAAIAGVTVAENASTSTAPSGVTASVASGTKNQATVSWSAPTDDGGSAISGYRIQASADGGATWTTVESNTGSNATTATVNGVRGGEIVFRVAAINSINVSPYSFPSNTVTIESALDIIPTTPKRYLDTRANGSTFDGGAQQGGTLGPGQEARVQIADRGGLPDDIVGAVLNVTMVNPGGNGFATVYPCSDDRPTASTINFLNGENTANVAITKLASDGDVCVFTSAAAEVLVDVTGYLPAASSILTIDPVRLVDSRANGETIDGTDQGTGSLVAGQRKQVQISGRSVVPSGIGGVIVNVTAVRPTGVGFVTVYPCSATPPTVANVNFRAGVNTATAAISELSSGGELCAFSQTDTDLILDVVGYLPAASAVESGLAARLVDTRQSGSKNPAGQVLEVQVTGQDGVPGSVTAAILNVAIVQPNGKGFATVFPCADDVPTSSTLNFVGGQNVQNLAVTDLDSSGKVCIFTSATAHVIVDARGFNP